MATEFYILDEVPDPWGDYGHTLMHGMAAYPPDNPEGLLELERCGPFVPPISLPGISEIVVTDSFRKELEQSGLAGMEFRPVAKVRIVNNPWHDGSRPSDEPPEYPTTGEPEDYILEFPHDPGIARQIGDLWELVPKRVCHTTRATPIVQSRKEIILVTDAWDGSDIFLSDGVGHTYVTPKARDWFLARVPELLAFDRASNSPVTREDE